MYKERERERCYIYIYTYIVCIYFAPRSRMLLGSTPSGSCLRRGNLSNAGHSPGN